MQKKMVRFQLHMKHIHPVHHFEKRLDGTQVNVVGRRFSKREAGAYNCAVVDHYLHGKTPWFKYRIRISNAAERTYFKWSDIGTILKNPVAPDAIFYAFYYKWYCYDDAWWITGKHINRITVDYDMDAEEDTKALKEDYQRKKCYSIESDLGYTPAHDVGHLRGTKEGQKMLM